MLVIFSETAPAVYLLIFNSAGVQSIELIASSTWPDEAWPHKLTSLHVFCCGECRRRRYLIETSRKVVSTTKPIMNSKMLVTRLSPKLGKRPQSLLSRALSSKPPSKHDTKGTFRSGFMNGIGIPYLVPVKPLILPIILGKPSLTTFLNLGLVQCKSTVLKMNKEDGICLTVQFRL